MKRAEPPLYPLRRTKDEDRAPADEALAFECRTAATFDRLRMHRPFVVRRKSNNRVR